MIDQEHEHNQMRLEEDISKTFQILYDLLQQSDREESGEVLGFVSAAKAIWEGDISTFAEDLKISENNP